METIIVVFLEKIIQSFFWRNIKKISFGALEVLPEK